MRRRFPFPREAIGPQVLPTPRPVSVGKPMPGANKLMLITLQPFHELTELGLLLAVKPAGCHVEYADDGQPSSLSFLNQRVVLGARVLMSAADPQPDRKL